MVYQKAVSFIGGIIFQFNSQIQPFRMWPEKSYVFDLKMVYGKSFIFLLKNYEP
jgi:hypothetical protein